MNKLKIYITLTALVSLNFLQAQDVKTFSLENAINYGVNHNDDFKNVLLDEEIRTVFTKENTSIGMPQVSAKLDYNWAYKQAISIIPADKDFTLGWMHPEFSEILQAVDSFELRRLHNWAGEIEDLEIKNKPYKIGCNMAMDQMVLLPNGDVTVCCSDLNSKGVIGNFLKDDLYTLYSNKRRRAYLDLLLKGEKPKYEAIGCKLIRNSACKTCSRC
mgnify:CR=1 FL=1